MEIFLNVGIIVSAFFVYTCGVTLVINRNINDVWDDRMLGRFLGSVGSVILFALGKMFL